ncbi:DNA helicase II [Celerinatantimonas diazotrophica]|uniref:DNA 3'-5' helicase n=1 Tax=Celerinatantimonas diazotrophica TaxID=412034 RepID=A0A4R1KFC2_9GAMM|nr:DNA helicase II [Celerinatantimonas diazotrophica]TCK63324.1 ATP-dependent DNA helicase UvrD [Celerinatantimonas diazotrophica]CAG9298468.1 DNA helicase II [Celerinatantimonas diazotrophica]
MDISLLLDGLNEKQRQAVAAPAQNMLVLAGAGSGKTRVLVHRIAYLLQVEGVSPYELMAVTFTNKAAAEMRHRVADLVGARFQGIWLGTFHGLAHRLLRAHYRDAKLPEDFQILDSDDQYRLVKRIIRGMNLDEKQWPPKQAMWFINGQKDEGLRPEHIDWSSNPIERQLVEIYRTYQDACERAGLVDFAELLLRALELLRNNKAILEHYQKRFRHILVDEFQDTNAIQYAWLRLLAGTSSKVMIVGDDDQSIYGWRGARVENIQNFRNDFADVDVIRLEQNYRSSATILRSANELIAHNQGRLGKNLWTEGADGDPISVYAAFNEVDEARFVVAKIRHHLQNGAALSECAILYRNNAQSRVLEEALMQEQLAYRIYGGVRFFERQEVKDALAYLRLMNNRHDDASFERVVNTPTRGIGQRTLELLRQVARERRVSLWNGAAQAVSEKLLTSRAANALQGFIQLVDNLAAQTSQMELADQSDYVIRNSGLLAMYQNEKGEKAEARVENLQELVTATRQFVPDANSEELAPLVAFLSHAALEAGDNQAEADESAVQLMTLHSAKGLEFPIVFLVGMEEGMFPSQQSAEEAGRLEEERRLAYVGMTRAMRKLYLCHAESRRLYGKESFHSRSRFIRELPQDCLEEIRLTTQVSQPMGGGRFSDTATAASFDSTGLSLGQRVLHPKFGEGVILQYEGSGAQSRVQVQFDHSGSKWLVVAFARLQPL